LLMKLFKIINKLQSFFPPDFTVKHDNCGLQTGNPDSEIKKIFIALEVTDEILDEAIESGANLILTHHPFIYSKVNSITSESYRGKLIINAIKNDMSIY